MMFTKNVILFLANVVGKWYKLVWMYLCYEGVLPVWFIAIPSGGKSLYQH